MPSKRLIESNKQGFTLIELLIVIAVIGILSSVTLVSLRRARESAYFAVTRANLRNLALAIELYSSDSGSYPADVDRDIPADLRPYIPSEIWPPAAWPGSVYDWDNWDDPDTGEKIYQISIRFCPLGQPEECRFPQQEWAIDFDYYSSVYYCISGPCRSHISKPITHPGYCVNCQ